MKEATQLEVGQNGVLASQFEKLADLKEGWLDGGGRVPVRRDLERLGDQLMISFPPGLATPFACLTPTGGVFLEWAHGDWIVSAEIPLPEWRCELQATNTRTNETVDEDRPLTDAGSFAAVYEFAGRFI